MYADPQEPWWRLEIEPRKERKGGGDVADIWKTNFLCKKLTGEETYFWPKKRWSTPVFYLVHLIFVQTSSFLQKNRVAKEERPILSVLREVMKYQNIF